LLGKSLFTSLAWRPRHRIIREYHNMIRQIIATKIAAAPVFIVLSVVIQGNYRRQNALPGKRVTYP
jgi:hypothetical protein